MTGSMRPRGGWTALGVVVFTAVVGGAVPARAQGTADGETPPPAAEAAPPVQSGETSFFETIEVGGFVDAYYLWSFNEAAPQLRNFDVSHNSFSLNYAEVALSRSPTEKSRVGFRVDFGAGDTATLVNAFEPGGSDYLKYVQQAYVSFLAPAGKGITIDVGKFVTPAGGEVIENKDNFNYSRGLLFALAIPYYHAGVRAAIPISETVTLTGYLVNGWNNVKDNNGAKTVGASVAFKPTGTVALYANYLVGKELSEDLDGGVRNLFDVVLSYAATPKLSLLGNVDYGTDSLGGVDISWSGVAVGAKYQATDKFAFAPRVEWFSDPDFFATAGTDRLSSLTLTGEYQAFGGLLTRFEYRTDFAADPYFIKDDDLEKTQTTFAVGLVYAFSSK